MTYQDGLAYKAPVRAATTANIALSSTQTVDGVSLVVGDRVLVKDQTAAVDNGIWIVSSGAWSRATDLGSVVKGTRVVVTDGTTNADTVWAVTSSNPINVGSDNIAFAAVAVGQYGVLDEDDMASDSADHVPTQQSVKAYADRLTFNQSATGDFWSDEGSPRIHRINDRVFIGAAVDSAGNHNAPYSSLSWLNDYGVGYADISADVMVLSLVGGSAVVGGSRSSDNMGGPTGPATIGVAGYAIGDDGGGPADAKTAWGGYFEGQKKAGHSGGVCGVEIEVYNESDPAVAVNPYNAAAGSTHAATLGSGAGNPIVGVDNSAALGIITTGTRHKKGIVFYSNALTRATQGDDTTVAIAMQFARAHQQEWIYNFAGARSAFIRSDGSDSTLQTGVVFNNAGFDIRGMRTDGVTENLFFRIVPTSIAGGTDYIAVAPIATGGLGPVLNADGPGADAPLRLGSKGAAAVTMQSTNGLIAQFSTPSGGVNRFNFTGSIAGSPLTIGALGSDANIDILFSPKGSGVLRFGAWASNADAAVNGYITVKDAAGNSRKLATIA